MWFQEQSIYLLLAYYPVTQKDIFLVRLEYLKNMLLIRLCLWIGLQIPFVICNFIMLLLLRNIHRLT